MPTKLTILPFRRGSTETKSPLLSSPTDSAIDMPFDKILEPALTSQAQPEYTKEEKKPLSSGVTPLNIAVRVLFILACAFISLLSIVSLARTIPNLYLPTSIEQVKHLALLLEDYSNETWQGYIHLIALISLIYIWKQAFSIPGAIFLNILAGALYGPIISTLLTSILTSLGASCAYFLGKFIGQPMLDQYLSDKLAYLRKQIDENREHLFYYLLFIRMFPLSPWWLLNIGSPLLFIPIGPFFTSMLFGSIPYNLASCQAGDILADLQSTADIWDPVLILKMLLVSLLSLIPPLLTKRIKKWPSERIKTLKMVSV